MCVWTGWKTWSTREAENKFSPVSYYIFVISEQTDVKNKTRIRSIYCPPTPQHTTWRLHQPITSPDELQPPLSSVISILTLPITSHPKLVPRPSSTAVSEWVKWERKWDVFCVCICVCVCVYTILVDRKGGGQKKKDRERLLDYDVLASRGRSRWLKIRPR